MEAKFYARAVALVAAFGVTIAVSAGGAQQPPPPAANASPAAPQDQRPAAPAQPGQPAARPTLPAAASSIAAKPEMYYGQLVSVYATVEKSLSPLAFTLDQDLTKSTGQEVIVLAPRLHEPVQPNTYVTVMGEVVRPDAAEIAKRAKDGAAGLPEILAQSPGRPVILATAVINSALIDLAKYRPPPMTPEEASFDKAMKAVGAANGALRKGVDGADVQLVKTNTAILAKAFAEAEAFWKGRGKADAVKFAQDARAAVQAIETASASANWNDAKTHNTTLGQQCAACHGQYRERGDDGSFFINEKGRK